MHLYALDGVRLIFSQQAEKGKNYFCPECHAIVRLKEGDIRQAHFFHLQNTQKCRLSQKGIIHLLLQQKIQHLFGERAEMERNFPEINRRADVACVKGKKIFEIQYSPISLDEAKERCRDYESLGYNVIWILHDHTFNQRKVSAAEQFLRTKTCYFTNLDEEGRGVIYDQYEVFRAKRRIFVDLRTAVNLFQSSPVPKQLWPKELHPRVLTWPLYHEGDVLDRALKGSIPFSRSKKTPLKVLLDAYMTALYKVLERNSK